ncbi:hypothetical protein GF325_02215, partial [Candidatus Bathyarchaeota archaeon]|nr:hypothetical protein [Candidatus Bathyarchaeota archaeon]
VVFPGCVVSYRFPKQVIKLFQLLVYLGADPGRIMVDDELCCGSFLRQIDGEMLHDNGKFLFSKYLRQDGTTLVITACGSCTATLRESKEYLEANHQFQERHGDPSRLTIMHYLDFLSKPAILKQLSGSLHEAANGKQVYLQFPCQAEGNLKERKIQQAGLEKLLAMLGYEPVKPKSDLTCCGSNLLDTHPDFAIEFGINRFKNITNIFKDGEGTIALGCGNCHRLLSDFKTSIEIEQDESDIQNLDTHFLLDLLVDTLGR